MKEATACHLKNTLYSWEKLRIVYNAVLLVEGLAGLWFLRSVGHYTGHAGSLYGTGVWKLVFFVGVAANLLYCAGPALEIIFRFGRGRLPLFGVGLLLSVLVIYLMGMRMYCHLDGWLH